MSRLRVSSVWNETTVSPPCDSSRAFGGRKRATTFIAELRTISIAGVGRNVPHDDQITRSIQIAYCLCVCGPGFMTNAVGSCSRSHVQHLWDTQPESKNRLRGLRTRMNLLEEG